jgi:hypothetical protein
MADTPERKVKKRVVEILKQYNVYYFFPATGGYGVSGTPDIVCCFKGRFLGIECKAGTGTLTGLQEIALDKIGKAGGITLVIRESNIGQVQFTLENM